MARKKTTHKSDAERRREVARQKARRIIASQGQSFAPGGRKDLTSGEQPPSAIFAQNMECVRRSREWLYDRLSESPQTLGLEVRRTKSGRPTLAVTGKDGKVTLLHSEDDPLAEAIHHVSTIKLEEADYLIILGFGLGYHVLEAMRRVPHSCKVFIIEQSADIFRAAMHVFDLTALISQPDVKIFVGTDLHEIMPALQNDFKTFKYHNIKIVIHPPSAALFPTYKQVLDNLNRVLRIVQINVNTVRFFSRLWLKHNLLNLPRIVRSPGVKSLVNQFPRKPAILVSAGPSLDKNIDQLRKAVGKAIILSADTCLRPLLAHGIRPNFVQAIDAQPITYRHFSGLDLSGIYLVGVTRLPPEVIGLFSDHIFFGNDLNNRVWKPIEPYFERLGTMGSGSTVAVLGFDLARMMGCDPIIFVGQDFSYAYGRPYAQGTMVSNDMLSDLSTFNTMETLTEAQKAKQQIVRTSDIAGKELLLDLHGRPTEMSDGMQGWLTWFTLEIKRTKARCINASEAGILTDGVEIMPLDEAIIRHCTEHIDVTKSIPTDLGKRGKQELKTVAKRLASIERELESVLVQAESIASGGPAGEKELEHLLGLRAEGEVCEPVVPLIDWHKQRNRSNAGDDRVKTEAQAMAFACQFAIEHLKQSAVLFGV